MTIKLFTVYRQIYMQNKQHALLQQIENKEKHMYWKQTENIYSSSITTKQDKARNERS